ncbi:hypothetical protein [Saccharothrix coeruleofusca]|uniref:Secreted protein n=1 Tax=Saccharothrix coeruleofusca TaxID=33919 RepID=A0A918ARS2_9PSEU|nr:hypothetical protein [Saccharothrix coeruleofusca]MBP2337082.1 hypothetical protein [Saccharothrix coeruleofusca]GGP67287.1 hypothetical protein GCM10010185_45190 [Saccharothrix coeruleofusca]
MVLMRRVVGSLVAVLVVVVSLTTATSGAVAVERTARPAVTDVGVLVYCTDARPVPGSVHYGNFGGDRTTACRKCDESMRVLRAKGRISAYSCDYNTSTKSAFAYVLWTCPWPLSPPCP